jgi:hypothetical protein
MGRGLGLGATVAVAAVAVGMLSGPSFADPVTVHAERLKRGPTAHVLFSDGTRLHTRASGVIAFPAGDPDLRSVRLLGKTPSTWVIWDQQSNVEEYVNTIRQIGTDGSASVVYSLVTPKEEYGDYSFWYRLSTNGRRFAENDEINDGGPGLTVRNLDGDVIGKTGWVYQVLDFSGPRMVYLAGGLVPYLWTPGQEPKRVTDRIASYAELKHDVIFLETTHGRYGPTRLSRPGSVPWKAHFQATLLSPNGRRVLGMSTRCAPLDFHCQHWPVFQIRSMSNGDVLSSFRTRRWSQDVAWEGNRAVLFPIKRASDGWLALGRCTVSGVCNRATGWMFASGRLSFPYMPDFY